jgi:hypothetical protein
MPSLSDAPKNEVDNEEPRGLPNLNLLPQGKDVAAVNAIASRGAMIGSRALKRHGATLSRDPVGC